jgi:hypothetical protein
MLLELLDLARGAFDQLKTDRQIRGDQQRDGAVTDRLEVDESGTLTRGGDDRALGLVDILSRIEKKRLSVEADLGENHWLPQTIASALRVRNVSDWVRSRTYPRFLGL